MPNLNLEATPILHDITSRFSLAVFDSAILKAIAENDLGPLIAYCSKELGRGKDNIAKAVAAEAKRKAEDAAKLKKAEGVALDIAYADKFGQKKEERTANDILEDEDILYGALSAMFKKQQGKAYTGYIGPVEQKKKGKISFDKMLADKVIFGTFNADLAQSLTLYKQKLGQRVLGLSDPVLKAEAKAQHDMFDEKQLAPKLNTFLAASRYSFASQQFTPFESETFDPKSDASNQFVKNLLKVDIQATLLPFLRSDELTADRVKLISRSIERLAIEKCKVGSDVTSDEIEKVKQLLDAVHRIFVAKEVSEKGLHIERTPALQERYALLIKEGVAVHEAFQGSHFKNVEMILTVFRALTQGKNEGQARATLHELLMGQKCRALFPNLKYARETGDKADQWSQFNKERLIKAIMADRRNPHSSAAVIDTLFMQKQAGEIVKDLLDVQDKNAAEQMRRRDVRSQEFKAYPKAKRAEFLRLIEIAADTDARYEGNADKYAVLSNFLEIARDIQPLKKSAADLEQKAAVPKFQTPAEKKAAKAQEEARQKAALQADMYIALVAQHFAKSKKVEKMQSVQSNVLLILTLPNAALVIEDLFDRIKASSDASHKALHVQLTKGLEAQVIIKRIAQAVERKESDFSRFVDEVVQHDNSDKNNSISYYLTELSAGDETVKEIVGQADIEMQARKVVKIYPGLVEEKQKVLERAYSEEKGRLVQREINVDGLTLLHTTSPVLEAMKRLDINGLPAEKQKSIELLKSVIEKRINASDFIANYLVKEENRGCAFGAFKQGLAGALYTYEDLSYFAKNRQVRGPLSFLSKLSLIASDDPQKANGIVDAYAADAALAKKARNFSAATQYLDSKNHDADAVMKRVDAFPAEVKKRAALFAQLEAIDGFSREQFEALMKELPPVGRNFSAEQKVDENGVMPENDWEKLVAKYANDPKRAALLTMLGQINPEHCRNEEADKLEAFLRDVPFNAELNAAVKAINKKTYTFEHLKGSSNPGYMLKRLNEKLSDAHPFFKDVKITAFSTMYAHFEKAIQERYNDAEVREQLRVSVNKCLNDENIHGALEEKSIDSEVVYKPLNVYLKLLSPAADVFLRLKKEKLGDGSANYKRVESIVFAEQAALHATVVETFCRRFAIQHLSAKQSYDFYSALNTDYDEATDFEIYIVDLPAPVSLALHQSTFDALKAAWDAAPQDGRADEYAMAMEKFEDQANLPVKEFAGTKRRIENAKEAAKDARLKQQAALLRDAAPAEELIANQLSDAKAKEALHREQQRAAENAAEDLITPANLNSSEVKEESSGNSLRNILERKDDASMNRFIKLGNAASVLAAKHIKARLLTDGKEHKVSDQNFIREIKISTVQEMKNQRVLFNDDTSGPSPLDRWRAGIDAWSSSNNPHEPNEKRERLFLEYQEYMRDSAGMRAKPNFAKSMLGVALNDSSKKVLLDKWYQATKIDKYFSDDNELTRNFGGDVLLDAQVALSLTYRPDVFPRHQHVALNTFRTLYACFIALVAYLVACTVLLIAPAERLKEHAFNVTHTKSDAFGKFKEECAFFQSRKKAANIRNASDGLLDEISHTDNLAAVETPSVRVN